MVFVTLVSLNYVSGQKLVYWPGGNICDAEQIPYGDPIWEENFDGDVLDAEEWTTYFPCRGQDDDQCLWARTHGIPGQIYRDNNIVVNDGKCTISLRREDGEWFGQKSPYTTGMIRSVKAFSHYTRYEILADMPDGSGVWPNFWMFGYGTELDVCEYNEDTNKYLIAVHRFDGGLTKPDWCCTFVKKDYPITEDFHLYAVEYEPYRVKFYLDDEIVGIMPRFTTVAGEEVKECENYEPQLMIEHNSWPEYGNPLNVIADFATLKRKTKNFHVNEGDMVIDYIKVYERDTPKVNIPSMIQFLLRI